MPSRGRILLIDDEPSVLLTYSLILQRNGYDVTAAAVMEEARAALASGTYDAVICDLNIAGEGGAFGFLGEFRARMPLSPMILLTGYASQEQGDEAARRGITLLFKPIHIPDLIAALEGAQGRQRTA